MAVGEAKYTTYRRRINIDSQQGIGTCFLISGNKDLEWLAKDLIATGTLFHKLKALRKKVKAMGFLRSGIWTKQGAEFVGSGSDFSSSNCFVPISGLHTKCFL